MKKTLEGLLELYHRTSRLKNPKIFYAESTRILLKELKFEIKLLSREEALREFSYTRPKVRDDLWERVAPSTHLWFVEELARRVGKTSETLMEHDFSKLIFEITDSEEKKSLRSLLTFYEKQMTAEKRAQQSPRHDALKELKQKLGIQNKVLEGRNSQRKAPVWQRKDDDSEIIQSVFPQWDPLQEMITVEKGPEKERIETFLFEQVREGNSAAVNALRALYSGNILYLLKKNRMNDKNAASDLKNYLSLQLMEFIKDYAMRELDKPPAERSPRAQEKKMNRRIALETYIYPRLTSLNLAYLRRLARQKTASLESPAFSGLDKSPGRGVKDKTLQALFENDLSREEIHALYRAFEKRTRDLSPEVINRNLNILDLRLEGWKLHQIGLHKEITLSKERVSQILQGIVRGVQSQLRFRSEARQAPADFAVQRHWASARSEARMAAEEVVEIIRKGGPSPEARIKSVINKILRLGLIRVEPELEAAAAEIWAREQINAAVAGKNDFEDIRKIKETTVIEYEISAGDLIKMENPRAVIRALLKTARDAVALNDNIIVRVRVPPGMARKRELEKVFNSLDHFEGDPVLRELSNEGHELVLYHQKLKDPGAVQSPAAVTITNTSTRFMKGKKLVSDRYQEETDGSIQYSGPEGLGTASRLFTAGLILAARLKQQTVEGLIQYEIDNFRARNSDALAQITSFVAGMLESTRLEKLVSASA